MDNDQILDLIKDGEYQAHLFAGTEIRKVFHDNQWHFCVIDIVEALTDNKGSKQLWSRIKKANPELFQILEQLKFPGSDGKLYPMDSATPEGILRIVQAIRSPRAEGFKRWLARVGYERIQEYQDPEIAIKRAILTYQSKGYDEDWINTRVRAILNRKSLTDEWNRRGINEGAQYAILTSEVALQSLGMIPRQHKEFKGLAKSDNLRDHMTDMELLLTMLGEKATIELAKVRDAQGFDQNREAATDGGGIAGNARRELETKTGKKVISPFNQKKHKDQRTLNRPLTGDGGSSS